MWNLGSTPGTTAISYDMIFTTSANASLTKAFSSATTAPGYPVNLVYTLANDPTLAAKSGLGFTDTLPSGLHVADFATSSCGGTVSAVQFGTTVQLRRESSTPT